MTCSYDIESINKRLSEVEMWISPESLNDIYTSDYWNNDEIEKNKELWISDGNYEKCQKYLETAGLLNEWSYVDEYISKNIKNKTHLQIADIAAGIGWTTALLSKLDIVQSVYATEISKPRLIELFPYAIHMLKGNPEKIKRYLGSFYDLVGFKSESMDVVFMSQAFHHADQPLKLLVESDRILKKNGTLILMGENLIKFPTIIRRVISVLLKEKRISFNYFDLIPPNNITGDHFYRVSDYYLMFQLMGYKVTHRIVDRRSLIIFAVK